MSSLALYRVIGNMNRVALGALADDVEFFTADRDLVTGAITLTPVQVIDGAAKKATVNDAIDALPVEGDVPFDV